MGGDENRVFPVKTKESSLIWKNLSNIRIAFGK